MDKGMVRKTMLNGINSQLETKRLILRPMLEADIDALHLIFTDPNVMAAFDGELLNREQMERWLQRNLHHQDEFGYGLFSVLLKGTGELIGDCGLERMWTACRWRNLVTTSEVTIGIRDMQLKPPWPCETTLLMFWDFRN